MHVLEADFLRQSYQFELSDEQIAQQPTEDRSASGLMVLPLAGNQEPTIDTFDKLLKYLPENCLVIANNSKVVPARIFGKRKTGGKVEMLLLTPPPLLVVTPAGAALPQGIDAAGVTWRTAKAEVLLRSSKKVAENEIVFFGSSLACRVRERSEFGKCVVDLFWWGELPEILIREGSLPLPPYIKREDNSNAALDAERYQTSYARDDKAGSVAAPTAGLHFTPELREALVQSGRQWAEVTLYVGYGTFSPVREDDIRNHPMHAEYVELSEETKQAVVAAKKEGRPVIAVGTTSARVLEGVWKTQHAEDAANSNEPQLFALDAYAGWINIFLYPGQQFHVIDGLITNFHLPESSLLMLVSALAGRERILAAYKLAVAKGFRFFSYGDAMLLC